MLHLGFKEESLEPSNLPVAVEAREMPPAMASSSSFFQGRELLRTLEKSLSGTAKLTSFHFELFEVKNGNTSGFTPCSSCGGNLKGKNEEKRNNN